MRSLVAGALLLLAGGAVAALVVAVVPGVAEDLSPGTTPQWLVVTVEEGMASGSAVGRRGPSMIDSGDVFVVFGAASGNARSHILLQGMGSGMRLDVRETVQEICAAIGDCADITRP